MYNHACSRDTFIFVLLGLSLQHLQRHELSQACTAPVKMRARGLGLGGGGGGVVGGGRGRDAKVKIYFI